MRAPLSRIWLAGVLFGAVSLRGAAAQQLSACYVPSVGAVYLVGQPNLPGACLAAAHVAITLGTGTIADGAVTPAKLATDQSSLEKVSGGVMMASNGIVSIGGHLGAARLEVQSTGSAILGTAIGPGFAGVSGVSPDLGVNGQSSGAAGIGVRGENFSAEGATYGVVGDVSSPEGTGVFGLGAATGTGAGVRGVAMSPTGIGVEGKSVAPTGPAVAVAGLTLSTDGTAVRGFANAATGSTIGVVGVVLSATGTAGLFEGPAGSALLRGISDAAGDRFRVEASGDVFADGAYNCGLAAACFNTGIGADVAERINASEPLEPGDVVEIDTLPETFRRASGAYSTRVAGIVATAPGITLGNNDLADNDSGRRTDRRPLLALVGRVPVKVTAEGGPIAVGDLLTSSGTPGLAMRCGDRARCAGAIVGKALEPLRAGTGRILALVTLQ